MPWNLIKLVSVKSELNNKPRAWNKKIKENKKYWDHDTFSHFIKELKIPFLRLFIKSTRVHKTSLKFKVIVSIFFSVILTILTIQTVLYCRKIDYSTTGSENHCHVSRTQAAFVWLFYIVPAPANSNQKLVMWAGISLVSKNLFERVTWVLKPHCFL